MGPRRPFQGMEAVARVRGDNQLTPEASGVAQFKSKLLAHVRESERTFLLGGDVPQSKW